MLLVEGGDTGEFQLLGDLFLLVVLSALLLIWTAPFWGLGVICWSWHREARQSREKHRQSESCSQKDFSALGPPVSSAVDKQFLPGMSPRIGT